MSTNHGLSEGTVMKIAGVLSRFSEVEGAVLFGSRAKATHHPGSDIDLALVGSALDWRIVGRIYDAMDDLLLPYRFSLINYDSKTDPEVAGHIKRVGIPLLQRACAGETLLNR